MGASEKYTKIVNPLYAINDRMCTLEDLFIEYQNLLFNDVPYYLKAPEKDYCPIIGEDPENMKVYYIEKDMLDNMMDVNNDIVTFAIKQGPDVNAENVSIDVSIYQPETNVSDTITDGSSTESTGSVNMPDKPKDNLTVKTVTYTKEDGTAYQWDYPNYWYYYVNSTSFNNKIKKELITYFNSTENINSDNYTYTLLNILETKLYNDGYKNTLLSDKTKIIPTHAWWSVAGSYIIDFLNYIIKNLHIKNNGQIANYCFYDKTNPQELTLYALKELNKFWTKISPTLTIPPYDTCCFMDIKCESDKNGYYILNTKPVYFKKYLYRTYELLIDGKLVTLHDYINYEDIFDMFNFLREYILKNFIYLPYNIPYISVFMGDTLFKSSLDYISDRMLYRQCDSQKGMMSYTVFPLSSINLPYNFIYDGTVLKTLTNYSSFNTYLKLWDNDNFTNTEKIKKYFLDALFNKTTYGYIIKLSDGNSNKDDNNFYNITTNDLKSYHINTYSGKKMIDPEIYLFAPPTINDTAYIKYYNATIQHTINNISYNIKLNQYPCAYIVEPVLFPEEYNKYTEYNSEGAKENEYSFKIVDFYILNNDLFIIPFEENNISADDENSENIDSSSDNIPFEKDYLRYLNVDDGNSENIDSSSDNIIDKDIIMKNAGILKYAILYANTNCEKKILALINLLIEKTHYNYVLDDVNGYQTTTKTSILNYKDYKNNVNLIKLLKLNIKIIFHLIYDYNIQFEDGVSTNNKLDLIYQKNTTFSNNTLANEYTYIGGPTILAEHEYFNVKNAINSDNFDITNETCLPVKWKSISKQTKNDNNTWINGWPLELYIVYKNLEYDDSEIIDDNNWIDNFENKKTE